MPVLCPRSSADFSAVCLPATVTPHASSSRSSSLLVLSSSTLRKRHRRCTRKAEASHQDGNPFVHLTSRSLAICHGEFVSRPSASGTNAVFNPPRMQEKEASVSIGRLSLEDTACLWNIQTQRTRAVETCAMKSGRRSNSSRFARNPESFSNDDVVEQNQFHGQGRSSRSFQDYDGSFLRDKRPKAPLLTENQPSRLHNEATVFEGIREPLKSRFDGYQHSDQPVLLDDAATGFSNVTQQGSKLISEDPEHKKRWRKGTMFLSKLEEELANLQRNINLQGRTGESLSFMHANQGSPGLISEAKGTEANGAQMGSREKGLQKTFVANKTSKENESELTSFNLFSSSPSVPWEVDTGYSSNVPIGKNRRPISRRTSTSIGSRSSASSRSVTARNNYSSKVGLQAMNAYDSAIKVIEEERHRKVKSDNVDERKLEEDSFNIQSLSENKATLFRDLRGNLRNLESDAASGISYALDSVKQPMETASAARENIDTQSLWKLEKDTFSEVVPLQSSSIPMPKQELHKYDEFDREDEMMDALESFSDESFSDDEEFPAVVVKDDPPVFSEYEANMPNQHSFSEIDGAKVSTSVPDAEHDIPGLSNSEDVDIENAYGSTRLNSSKGEKHLPQNAATWHKHKLPGLPFDFQFSYSEIPQSPILGYRETPFSPFGPRNTKRPWTGGPPNNPSKKKQYVLDSFNPPPNNTKGVKPVEAPGPYPEGHGPKAARSREEILGEPLTKEEIVYLVEKCKRETRQLNLGRDGLTHNMLDLIHSYWKRRRVCRIKCKGVPTVDMDNVKFHIEDKTGGKIIYHRGGVFYLFRGRNYNYKDRPNIPMMLWKPRAPLYPKLIQPAPEGLTIEDATRLRYLGRKVQPICTLGKNGVYLRLVEDVRDAFKVDDLVRVDCQKLNPSDYKKIGAKLRDLVPCVLLSFDKGNLLMWKGKQENQATVPHASDTETMAQNISCGTEISNKTLDSGYKNVLITPDVQDSSGAREASNSRPSQSMLSFERESIICEEGSPLSVELLSEREHEKDLALLEAFQSENALVASASSKGHLDEEKNIKLEYVVAVDALWEHALQSSMAVELQEEMDSDRIVRKADEVAQSAPLAPEYSIKLMYKLQLKRDPDYKPTDEVVVNFGRVPIRKQKKAIKMKPKLPTVGVPGMGGLPVDGLAKLLVEH